MGKDICEKAKGVGDCLEQRRSQDGGQNRRAAASSWQSTGSLACVTISEVHSRLVLMGEEQWGTRVGTLE